MDPASHQIPLISVNNCGNVTDSYKNVWNNCNISVSDKKRRVLEWLSPLASRGRHQAVRDSMVDGVGDWLLRDQTFSTWRTSEDQAAKPVLLCYGNPGVGKTYVSSLVIDTLSKAVDGSGVAVAYVYCDFSAQNVQSASTVLGSVLRQVVGALARIPEEVQKAFEHAKSQVDSCGLRLGDILEMLSKSLSGFKQSFICIDALDEFPLKHQPDLWVSLKHVVRKCPNTRLFLTGRPQIRDQVRKYFPGSAEMLEISTKEYDVELYLRMRLSKDPEFDAMDDRLQADILRMIPERISGIFLLVRINMDAILAEPTIHKRRQALHKITNSPRLQDAYNSTLDRIRQQGGSKAKLGLEALMWISHCERQLKSEELCHALGVEIGAEDISAYNVPSMRVVLGCTFGLLTVDEKPSTVRLLHQTLQEYLGGSPTLFVTAHSMMAEICLTYLNYQSVRALQPKLDTGRATTPFLEYASCFWGGHAAMEVTESVKSLALRVLDVYENHGSSDVFWRRKVRERPVGEDVLGISGLHCIAFWGITEIAIAMMEMKRWDVNQRDSEGNTALIWALGHGNSRIAELLLEQEDIEPDVVNKFGCTALFFAARFGEESLVKSLLGRGDVNPDSTTSYGQTPLSSAAQKGYEGVVKLFLERGGVNPDSSDNDGRTPLSSASWEGHEGVVKLLLERGDVKPDSSDKDGRTPLSYAASRGHEVVVKLLLERGGVNPGSSDSNGQTPLSHAAYAWPEQEGIVKLLLEHTDVNPDSPDTNGGTPLLSAASRGNEGVMKLLLERGNISPDSPNKSGRTPLSFAAEGGHEGVVKLLLGRGDVNPDSSDKNSRTPLSFAASGGHLSAARLPGRGDANPGSSDNNGPVPPPYAGLKGYEAMVRQLLGLSANTNLLESKGRKPLSHAARMGHGGIAEVLLRRHDVNPNSFDKDGRTPLSFAVDSEEESMVQLFLGRGDVNPNIPDNHGRTPLSFAARAGARSVVELLLRSRDVNLNLADNDGRKPLSYFAAAELERERYLGIFLGHRKDMNV